MSKLLHWNYFLTLEDDLEVLSQYLEFNSDNFGSYSTKMVRLLLAAGSEIDVVLKELCKKYEPDASAESIDRYRECINPRQPAISTTIARLPKYELEFVPWKAWQTDSTPDWWRSYNLVKHNRGVHYREANLINTVQCLAGLYVAVLFLYLEEFNNANVASSTKIFLPNEEYIGGVGFGTFGLTLAYELPHQIVTTPINKI